MTITANWYHCSVKPISRSAGRSAVAAVAYRIGDRLHDERTQTIHDYSRRTGVEASFIIAPNNAPKWAADSEQLWNAAEAAEKRCNSQTAREIELALPSGVSAEVREQITRDFVQHLVDRYGVAVETALHSPSKHGDERNHHAHIVMTTRQVDENGLGKKTRELDDLKQGKIEVLHIREYAADLINAALERSGSDERITHLSLKERGIDQIPTEHLGVEATAKERRGETTRIGDQNREIAEINAKIAAMEKERAELEAQIKEHEESQSLTGFLVKEIKGQIELKNRGLVPWVARTFHLLESIGEQIKNAVKNEHHIDEQAKIDAQIAELETTKQSLLSEENSFLTQQEQLQSAIKNTTVIAFKNEIAENGEIEQKGFGNLTRYITDLAQAVEQKIEYALDAWHNFIDRDHEPER